MADIDALTDPAISDRDALGEFLESLTDKVPTIERDIARLKRNPRDRGLIADLFRALHNIKGDAAICKVEMGVRVAHPIETVLARLREGEIGFSEQLAEVILLALDRLEMATEAVAAGQPVAHLKLPQLVAGLERLKEGSEAAIAAQAIEVIEQVTGFRPVLAGAPTIPSEARKDDADTSAAWERDRPMVFGALLDLFANALRLLPSVKLAHKQRMADYERFGEAVARALGFEPGEFQRQYAELVRAGIDRALESNAVAQVLDKYFEERISPWNWQGTAGQLYDLLNNQIIPDRSTWPKSPKGLADQLRRIAPAYRAKGIEISHLGHSREGALWRITPIRSSTATPPGVEGGIRYGAHRE